MTDIAAALQTFYPMNEQQRAITAHKQGPLLVTAGPGSGKTRSLLLLAMNLILCNDAQPSEIILCTYTEKAAREMQGRLMKIAREVQYSGDLAPLRIDTIHGICKQLISENNHYLPIENDFITLDPFTQQLLIFEEMNSICTPDMQRFFQKRWGSFWQVAKELGATFDKITEELLFEQLKTNYAQQAFASLTTDNDRFRYCAMHAYKMYQKQLEQRNCLDFAHLQKCIYNLLLDPAKACYLTKGIRYVLVDEYQDTNYIQERILTLLASATSSNNLFVVGDEDQALYRFRGATVRNILEFEQTFPGCRKISLMANYRSHHKIIQHCNKWISSIDWSNPQGLPFRTAKEAHAASDMYVDYPAVCTMQHKDIYDEAEQFAELVVTLKQQGKIGNYAQVALLLHSVKSSFSTPYIEALERRGIAAFCPRATSYFDQEEVQLLIGCFAHLLHFEENPTPLSEEDSFSDYLYQCRAQLKKASLSHLHLRTLLFHLQAEIKQTEQKTQAQGKTLLDYFYRILTVSPFLHSLKGTRSHAAQPGHLQNWSELLQTFQRYYRHTGLTFENQRSIAHDFFQKFLPLLYSNGFKHDEATLQRFPSEHVPILTIHQAKGLEFPVVVAGRLDKIFASSDNQRQRARQNLSARELFEPVERIPTFDLQRLYYVAFSRAKRLLVLMAVRKPGAPLVSLWQQLPPWSQTLIKNMPASETWEKPEAPQPRYGLTNDIQLYTTCPRQFQFFRSHNFLPSSNGVYFSGQLIHQTLEHIHRVARDRRLEELNEQALAKVFEHKFQALTQSYIFPIDDYQKEQAWRQILRYFQQNQETLHAVEAAELAVQVDKQEYVLTGKIDLLLRTRDGFDLIDFKTLARPVKNSRLLEQYEQQLHFYAHALEQSRNRRPERLFLYWTAEERKENALMEVPYQPEKMHQLTTNLQSVVERIKNENFHVQRPPAPEICHRCDIRYLCRQDGIIEI